MANDVKINIDVRSKQALTQLKALQRVAVKIKRDFERLDIILKRLNKTQVNSAGKTAQMVKADAALLKAKAAMISALARQNKTQKTVNNTKTKSISIMSRLTKSMTIGVTVGNLLSSAIKSVTRGFISAGAGAIKTASEFETLRVQFGVLTRDTAVANDLFQDLTEFSAKTPFRLKDIAGAAQKLLAFGSSAEQVKTQIRVLGDVVGATGSDLGEVARVFGQIQAKGNLTGERNLQLMERGIVLFPELAKVMGKPISEMETLQKQGKITSEDVEKAFTNMTKAGGVFFQGTIKLAKTAAGIWSTLKDNIDLLADAIGQNLLPFLKVLGLEIVDVLGNTRKWMTTNNELTDTYYHISRAIASIVTPIKVVVDLFGGFRTAVQLISSSLDLFVVAIQKTIGLGISVFSTALEKLLNAIGKPNKALADFNRTLDVMVQTKFSEVIDEGSSSLNNIARDADKAKRSIDDFVASIDNKLATASVAAPDITVGPKGGKTKTGGDTVNEDALKALKKFQEERASLIKAAALAETEFVVAREIEEGVRQETRLAKLISDLGKEEAIKFEARLRNSDNAREAALTGYELDVATSERKLELLNEEAKNRVEMEKNVADIINEIKKDSQKRDEEINKTKIKGMIALFGALASASELGGKKMFKVTKALNIAEATMAGITATNMALKNPPGPPYTIPLAAAVGVSAAVNVAKIASQKPPAYEKGGIVPGSSYSGDNTIARVNSGEMILNQQQQKQVFNQLNSGSGPTNVNSTIVVELDGEVVGRAVSKQVANGLTLGEVV